MGAIWGIVRYTLAALLFSVSYLTHFNFMACIIQLNAICFTSINIYYSFRLFGIFIFPSSSLISPFPILMNKLEKSSVPKSPVYQNSFHIKTISWLRSNSKELRFCYTITEQNSVCSVLLLCIGI